MKHISIPSLFYVLIIAAALLFTPNRGFSGTEANPEIEDPAGDQQSSASKALDLRAVWISQSNDGYLLVYMKVEDLSGVTDTVTGAGLPANGQWKLFFNANGGTFFVQANNFADDGFGYSWGYTTTISNIAGTITGTILKSKNTFLMKVQPSTLKNGSAGNPQPGQKLSNLRADIRVFVGAAGTGGLVPVDDATGTDYTLTPFGPELITPDFSVKNISITPRFSWGKTPGATSYQLQVSTAQNFSTTVINQTVADTFYTSTTLDPSTRYYWRVNGTGTGGAGPYSQTWSFTTGLASPALRTPDSNAMNVATKPEFTWDASTGATSYQLQVSTVSDFSSTVIDQSGLATTSFTPTSDLNLKTMYYWRVNAAGVDGPSAYSLAWPFTTQSAVSVENNNSLTNRIHLLQNYPNPFSSSTTIVYELDRPQPVTLRVLDVLGREVARLATNRLETAGLHSIEFSPSNIGNGLYYYQLQSGNQQFVKTLTILQ